MLFCLSAEFLAIIYIIIYVGAIAILFLFVVMMLNVRIVELEESFVQYVPLSFLLVFIFFLEILYSFFFEFCTMETMTIWVHDYSSNMNIALLGSILYTNFGFAFILSGLLLLLAMIGSIVLTSFHEKDVLRQDVFIQIERNYLNTIRLIS